MERHLISIVAAAAAVSCLGGCTAVHVTATRPSQNYPDAQAVYDVRPEPPPLGSAFRYRYFPRVQVYFSPDRACYYWREAGRWRTGKQLPAGITFRAQEGVDVTLDSDVPYVDHDRVHARYNNDDQGGPDKSWEAGRTRDDDEHRDRGLHKGWSKGKDDDKDNNRDKSKDKDKDKGKDTDKNKGDGHEDDDD